MSETMIADLVRGLHEMESEGYLWTPNNEAFFIPAKSMLPYPPSKEFPAGSFLITPNADTKCGARIPADQCYRVKKCGFGINTPAQECSKEVTRQD